MHSNSGVIYRSEMYEYESNTHKMQGFAEKKSLGNTTCQSVAVAWPQLCSLLRLSRVSSRTLCASLKLMFWFWWEMLHYIITFHYFFSRFDDTYYQIGPLYTDSIKMTKYLTRGMRIIH